MVEAALCIVFSCRCRKFLVLTSGTVVQYLLITLLSDVNQWRNDWSSTYTKDWLIGCRLASILRIIMQMLAFLCELRFRLCCCKLSRGWLLHLWLINWIRWVYWFSLEENTVTLMKDQMFMLGVVMYLYASSILRPLVRFSRFSWTRRLHGLFVLLG